MHTFKRNFFQLSAAELSPLIFKPDNELASLFELDKKFRFDENERFP